MSIDQVIQNIDQTIAGKSLMLEALGGASQTADPFFPQKVLIPMIELNLKELTAIRKDLLEVKKMS